MKFSRLSIEAVNRVATRLRSRRRLRNFTTYSDVRLNLGCGLAVCEGWINIDGSMNALIASLPSGVHSFMYYLTGANQYYTRSEYCQLLEKNVFVHHDLASGIPVVDNVADYIYSSHFVEHLYQKDAMHLLRECYRVLKSDGILRISIPDLEYVIKLYHAGRKDEMLRNYFFVEDGDNHYSRHKYMYDFEMLKEYLRDAGFRKIVRCQYKEGSVPDIEALDNRPDESLYVEAVK